MGFDWDTIARLISEIEGKPVSKEECQATAQNAIRKLKKGLMHDPVIKEWLKEKEE